MDSVEVRTLKGFDNGGFYVGRNQAISVTEQRARELERNGLITRMVEAPLNKMAPRPRNKRKAK